KEVVLIGINLSAYGKENGKTLADAVEAVKAAAPNMRIRLGSMEPDQLDDITIERLAKIDTLCPQFHLSLQSGCDNTLKRMNRHYDTAFYRALVNKLRSCFDDCAITTDIMVGFAGETEQDHTDSVAFLREIGFARTHVFAYSRRRGTAADKFDGQIENSVKRRRSKEMIEAAKDCMDSFIDGQLGRTYPVLIENRTKDGVYEGYTPNYTRVFVKTDRNIGGEIVDIRLKKRVDDSAFGELV
ncbi:MAG: radical SAM protein, partial [Acutalibacteraceae bacterium]|nr:radical SAM protein [Acutalibacteraceae bacterium]